MGRKESNQTNKITCSKILNIGFLVAAHTNEAVLIATNQQVLVAVTIRGSVLFYSSAVRRPDFHSVTELLYLYGVDSN